MRYTLKNGEFVADQPEDQGEPEVSKILDTVKRVSADAARRAARTFVQAFVGSLSMSLPTVTATTDLNVLTATLASIGISAAVAGASAVVSLIQNSLEDAGKIQSRK